MTNRDYVLAALQHQQPGKVPFDVGFTQACHEKMAEYYGDDQFAEKLDNCLSYLSIEVPGGWREVAPDIWEDEFGVQWNRSIDKDIGVVCNRMVTPENLEEYVFPDPADPARYADYGSFLEQHRDQFVVVSHGFSLFERAWTLAGMETVLIHMVDNEVFLHRLLDRILEFNLRVVDEVCTYPIDAVMFGDDWGQQTGLIMGPELWRKFIKPRVRQMYSRAKEHGKYVFIHSCGKVDGIFPDLIECGLDVFNPFQPEVMDVWDVKRQYGKYLTFFGGISTQRLLPYGTPEEVRTEVTRLLKGVGRGGGYIAAPAHSIPGDARPENVAAMIEVLHNQ